MTVQTLVRGLNIPGVSHPKVWGRLAIIASGLILMEQSSVFKTWLGCGHPWSWEQLNRLRHTLGAFLDLIWNKALQHIGLHYLKLTSWVSGMFWLRGLAYLSCPSWSAVSVVLDFDLLFQYTLLLLHFLIFILSLCLLFVEKGLL